MTDRINPRDWTGGFRPPPATLWLRRVPDFRDSGRVPLDSDVPAILLRTRFLDLGRVERWAVYAVTRGPRIWRARAGGSVFDYGYLGGLDWFAHHPDQDTLAAIDRAGYSEWSAKLADPLWQGEFREGTL